MMWRSLSLTRLRQQQREPKTTRCLRLLRTNLKRERKDVSASASPGACEHIGIGLCFAATVFAVAREPAGSCPGDGERRTRTADTSIFSRGATSTTRHAEPSKRPVFAGISGCPRRQRRAARPAEIPADTRRCRGVWADERGPSAQTKTRRDGRMARGGLEPSNTTVCGRSIPVVSGGSGRGWLAAS